LIELEVTPIFFTLSGARVCVRAAGYANVQLPIFIHQMHHVVVAADWCTTHLHAARLLCMFQD
jgi:hypothetical protein